MATITNTIKLFAECDINGIITLHRNVNSDNARRKFDGRAVPASLKLHAHLHQKTIPDGCSVCQKNRRKFLDAPVGKDTISRTLKKDFDLT